MNQTTPRAGRPQMPKGYGVPEHQEGLIAWEKEQERLEKALVYWVATTRPDGRPHVSPVWGAWLNNTFFFEGSPETRRVRNLAANAHMVMHLEGGPEGRDVLIVEGEAHPIEAFEPGVGERLAEIFTEKYVDYKYHPDPKGWLGGGMYAMRPRQAMAWTQFFADATRWEFS